MPEKIKITAENWEQCEIEMDGQIETLSNRINREFESGIKAGYSKGTVSVVQFVMQKAGEQFAKGNDAEAKTLRALALEIKVLTTPARPL